MATRWARRGAALIALMMFVLGGGKARAQTTSADDLATLNKEVARLYTQGKYADATEIAKRALALAEGQLGPHHEQVGTALNNLALMHQRQGRYAEAEPLYKRALDIWEKALGAGHGQVGIALNGLAVLYKAQGRHAEAEPLFKRALAIGEKTLGPDNPQLATWLNNLAELYRAQGRHADAEPLHERSLAIRDKVLGPHHPDVGQSLNNLAELYHSQGRYTEAEASHKRSLAIREQALGSDHPDVGTALNNLAALYQSQGRYVEAEPLLKRSLAIREKALGPHHPDVANSLNNLAGLYREQARYGDAEPLYQRTIAIFERALGPDHAQVGAALNNLAELYGTQGRYAEAEQVHKRALTIVERALGPDHVTVATLLNNMAALYHEQARYTEAEQTYHRALAIGEKTLGPHHPVVATRLNNLARLYGAQARYPEAEALYRRSLGIRDKSLGPDHPHVGTSLSNLAAIYSAQARYGEAEPLYLRALAIAEKALRPNHPSIAQRLNNLASLYKAQGRLAEAEPLYVRALAIREAALPAGHPEIATSLNNLAALFRAQGRLTDAEPLYQRALIMRETVLPAGHPDIATSLNNLAFLYTAQGRLEHAEPLYRRALALRETGMPVGHPDIATSLNNLASLYFMQRDWARAADFWRRSTAIIARRTLRGSDDVGQPLTGRQKSEAEQLKTDFWGLIKAVYRLTPAAHGHASMGETVEAAQWALASEAATALAQMAARGAKGNVGLGVLVRERQDLLAEWQHRDATRTAAVSQTPDKRDRAAEAASSARLDAIDRRIAELDKQLKTSFPDFAAMSRPEPLSIAEIQAHLRADEALVMVLDTPEWKPEVEETFMWVITTTDTRWVRSELGTSALTREVAALRCGLDATAWDGDGTQRCAELLAIPSHKAPTGDDPLPFDAARAHALYKALLGSVEDLIVGKKLLLVPSGPLTQLPFQVLLTAPPTGTDHRAMAWLARKHNVTVLPAVSSLKALRRVARPSVATKQMIGFGNPLLDGPDSRYAERAKLARDSQHCLQAAGAQQQMASLRGPRYGVTPVATRGGLADLAHLKAQTPLPETAAELCAVARDLGADLADMRLGARATEHEIKALSDSGELARYRIVHFATHGTLAGQLTGTTEPGLILTPPDAATPEDDGYLSASEVAGLKLDADWVILSACNTAAAGATGAEALSGLARAFFYAQARALLVSHWEVYSDATVKLIASAVGESARDRNVGRAEALRRAMLALIDKGDPHEAHPAYWAPFVLVGEGAAK